MNKQRFHPGAARIARNSLFVFTARIFDIAVALAATALIARYLGVVDFGHYAFVMAITIFLGPFIDLGVDTITTREIVANKFQRNRLLGSAVIARLSLSAIIFFIIYCTTILFDWDSKVVLAIYIATFNQIFLSTGMLAIATFQAFERMEYQLGLKFVFNILYLVLVVTVIWLNMGFLAIFGARLVASLLQAIVMLFVAFKKFLRPVFEVNIRILRYLLKEAIPLGVFSILLTASFKVDVFVLKYFKGPEDLSLFEVAHRIILQLQLLPVSIIIAMFPHFTRQARGSIDALGTSFSRTFKFLLVMSLPLPIIIAFLSDTIISILFGANFSAASSSLIILSWTIPFLFLIALQSFVMTSEGRQVLNTISAGFCFIINLLLDIIFVPRYGYLGASYATLISYISLFTVSFYFVTRTLGIPPLLEILPKPLLSACAMGMVGTFLYQEGGPLMITLESTIIIFIYIMIIYLLRAFSEDELSIIRGIFLRHNPLRSV